MRPHTSDNLQDDSFVNLDGERKIASDMARVLCADTERGLLDAEDMKKEALRASLDAQVAEKASKRQDEDRYDRIQESRKQSEDALRYQGEVLDDMARRREAAWAASRWHWRCRCLRCA